MSSSQTSPAKLAADEIFELSETFKEQVRDLPQRLRVASRNAERRTFAPKRREPED